MMSAILSIQLSAFGNKKILPNTENISVLMPKLKEFSGIELLPNIIDTPNIDIETGSIKNVPNLSFVSIDNKSQVVCTESRIDCVFNFDMAEQSSTDLRFDTSSEIISFIMQNGNVMANRLALNVTHLSDVCNGNSVFEKQVMHTVPFYQGKNIKEWSSRINAFGQMTINGNAENLNVITEYTQASQSTSGEIRIACHTDINTVAENKDFRFEYAAFDVFVSQAKEIFKSIQSDLEELMKNEE
ncbi:MAG: hypothetical protein NC407_09855 [Lachnoclostridium sp.]|nr:hypothetical protein [Lachnoclostridium sp.]